MDTGADEPQPKRTITGNNGRAGQQEALIIHGRGEIAAGETKAERIRRGSMMRLLRFGSIARAAGAGDGDEGIVKAGALDAERFDPGAAVDQRLEQGLGPRWRKLEGPVAIVELRAGGEGRSPRPVGGAGAQADDRAQAATRLVDLALERDPGAGDDRDPLAQPPRMGDDGVEKMTWRRLRPGPDQFSSLLGDRVEAGKGFIEHDQLRLVTIVRAIARSGHALGEIADWFPPSRQGRDGRAIQPLGAGLRATEDHAARP